MTAARATRRLIQAAAAPIAVATALFWAPLLPTVAEAAPAATVAFSPVAFTDSGGTTPSAVASADFDHDGTNDVAVTNEDSDTVTVLANAGKGALGARGTYSVGEQPWAIVAADFNHDGYADLAVANATSDDVSILLNQGNGTFGPEQVHRVGFTPSAIAAADVTGDGKVDLVTTNLDDNDISVLVGDGRGGFADAASVPVGLQPTGVAVGDVTGDGLADVVVSNFQSDSVTVLAAPFDTDIKNFTTIHSYPAGFSPAGLVLADLDGNHSLDLAVHVNSVPASGPDYVSVLLNDGHGGFGAPVQYPAVGVRVAVGIAAGDFNDDGAPDIAVSGANSNSIGVLLGDGHGHLGGATVADAQGSAQSLIAARLTGAQGPDLVAGYSGTNHIGVFPNASPFVTPPGQPASTADLFNALTPTRVFDTRDGSGGVPVGKVVPGHVLEVPVAGRFGIPASGVGAVALNVTATEPDGAGFVRVYPCGALPLASNLNVVAGQTVPNMVIAPVSANGTVCFFTSTTTHLLADVSGWFATSAGYSPTGPVRAFDTRDGSGGVPEAKLTAGQVLEVPVAGRFGIPATGVGAVALNVTATEPDRAGFVTVFPCGGVPLASNLNVVAGQTVPNMVIAPVSPNGTVCFYTSTPTHLLADVSGWFAAGQGFNPTGPTRMFDTRDGSGGVIAGKLAAGHSIEIPVTGRFGLPATGVSAVALNVTATEPDGPGFVTVYPCGQLPLASNLNVVAGQTVPNAVIAPVSATGTVCFYTTATTHLLADVSGWFAPAPASGPAAP